jgi:radical SAM superfamily enzyme YgiQ (UPF0313 family)
MPRRTDIILATLNARYIHSAFGLRYLQANLGELQSRCTIREFEINQRPLDVAEALLADDPLIIGLGVYIWNIEPMTQLVSLLKRLRPELPIIIGGPEVSYECDQQEIVRLADTVITGEADLVFPEVCRQWLAGVKPPLKVVTGTLPNFDQLTLPYDLYSDDDIAHRIVYLEASRGCPFTCEFCLSSLDVPVRALPLERLLPVLQSLFDRGVQHFKFVDRTFNLNLNTSRAILQFLLDRHQPGMLFHFEMIPDRLPEGLRELIAQFPAGALQFEVGIQTFSPLVAENIRRRNNYDKLADNFRYLREHTGVHIHADLIAGLPGETMESFAAGFDRLVALRPQEIQLGILKRLRGTPITRHDETYGMRYAAHAPYEILETATWPFSEMQRMRRLAKYWDLIGNSGNFVETTPLILQSRSSAFAAFLHLSDWLYEKGRRTTGVALQRLVEWLFTYLQDHLSLSPQQSASVLWNDFSRHRPQDKPPQYLAQHLPQHIISPGKKNKPQHSLTRQARHLTAEANAL